MSKRIGVGVISLGWMGRLHARSYRALAERYRDLGAEVRLAAACDPARYTTALRATRSAAARPGRRDLCFWPLIRSPIRDGARGESRGENKY